MAAIMAVVVALVVEFPEFGGLAYAFVAAACVFAVMAGLAVFDKAMRKLAAWIERKGYLDE